MATLPAKNLLDGSKSPTTTVSEMKSAMGAIRDFLADLLGTDSSNKEAARTALGATSTGNAVFTATDAAAARTAVGGTAVGSSVLTAADAAAARSAIGVGSATSTAAGLVELADATEASAGIDATRSLTPSTLRSALNAAGSAPIYAARAFVNFDGTGTAAIRLGANVSSITDNGLGDYTVNFATAMPDADYVVTASISAIGLPSPTCLIVSQTTTSVRINLMGVSSGSAAAADASIVCVAIFR